MSSDAVVQRRNKQIQDTIDSQNFKQALQLCEKRLKKGEDTPYLRVCFLISLSSPLPHHTLLRGALFKITGFYANSSLLQAWKAHILFRHADDAHRQRGVRETMELCNLEPPISDLDALDMLQQTLKRMGNHEDTMRAIWERAAKAKPQQLELQTRWFNHSSERCDWKSAQKVSHSIYQNISFILHLLASPGAKTLRDLSSRDRMDR